MIIGCTKKLQDEIGIIAKSANEEKDLFSWSANVIKVNRRKTVVVVNDSNRFGFVLYGLKAKDFKKIDELILDGIRSCLRNENIKEEIIEQYLREAGVICFSKTRGPKYVSRLNRACECAAFFEDIFDLDNIYQFKVTGKINNDFVKINNNYEYPYNLLLEDFKQVYGNAIVQCEAAILRFKLNLGSYTAERRIVTPINIDFKGLHEIIQKVFAWRDYHLYDFNVMNKKGECVLNVISEHEDMYDLLDDRKVVLESEVLIKDYVKAGFSMLYSYDFGDGWNHEITVEDIITNYDKNYPICLEGVGEAPPEDVGGIPGYEEFLEIIASPEHPEYESIKSWGDSQGYKKYDVDLVNRKLRYDLRR